MIARTPLNYTNQALKLPINTSFWTVLNETVIHNIVSTVTDLISWLHYLEVCLDREIHANYCMDYLNDDLINTSDYV